MGKVGRFIAGVVLTVGGVVVGVATGNWSLAAAMISTGVGFLLNKPPRRLAESQGTVLENRVGAQQPIMVVYGTTQIGGALVDVRVDANSTERKRLVIVVAWCHGSRDNGGVQSIEEVWFDDRKAIAGAPIGVIQVPFSTLVPGQGSLRHLEFAHHLGETTQVVDSRLSSLFPAQWASSAKGAGIAYTRLELWYNTEIYPSGIPTFLAKIRGNRVFDPRDSVWKHSSNPALCIRDYLLSPIYGLGVGSDNIDEQSFIDMANYCDELVTNPNGGTQKRFELNGWLDPTRGVEQNLADLAISCRAQVVNEGERWRMVIRRQRTVSGFKINADNTVEGSWSFILPGATDSPNVMRATYVDPAQKYSAATVQWPNAGAANPFLTADASFEVRGEVDLPFVDNRARAQQIAMTLLKEQREAIIVMCTLKETALQARIGDLVEVSYPTPGWTDKVFDVVALLLQTDGGVRAVLVEHEPTVYDIDAQPVDPDLPDTDLPDPFTVAAPTSLILTSLNQALQTNDGRYIPRIRAEWTKAVDPFVDYYEIQAKRAVDVIWDTFGRVPGSSDALFFVYPVTDESWDVRISAVNTVGVRSTFLSGTHLVVTPDPRPQILSITLTNSHVDIGHTDVHTDVAHGDAGHTDSHSDVAHSDHTDHSDTHSDIPAHSDSHSDTHGDGDLHMDSHGDHGDAHTDSHTDSSHTDQAHNDHSDIDIHHDFAHSDHSDTGHLDAAHTDTHSDVAHADSAHGDGHQDTLHSDGQHGIGVAIQADSDSASIKAVARKHGDVAHTDHVDGAHSDVAHTDVTEPTVTEVRTQPAVDGRNVVIELIDTATGTRISMVPGDRVRVGAVAYAEVTGGGVEGPLALGSVGLFNVAPVGTDLWFPA